MKEKTEWEYFSYPEGRWLCADYQDVGYDANADLRWINFGQREIWWSSGLNKDGKILGDSD